MPLVLVALWPPGYEALWSRGLPRGQGELEVAPEETAGVVRREGSPEWVSVKGAQAAQGAGGRGSPWSTLSGHGGTDRVQPWVLSVLGGRGLPQRRCSGLLGSCALGRRPLSDGVTNCDRKRPSSGSSGERRGRWRGSRGRRLRSLETPGLLNLGDARSPSDVETLNWAIFLKYEKEEVLSRLLDVVERMRIFGVKQMGSGFQLWLCILSGSSS